MFHQLLVEEDMMTSEAVGSQTTLPYTTDQHTVGNLPLFSNYEIFSSILSFGLKVSYFRNEFKKSSFLPKYEHIL